MRQLAGRAPDGNAVVIITPGLEPQDRRIRLGQRAGNGRRVGRNPPAGTGANCPSGSPGVSGPPAWPATTRAWTCWRPAWRATCWPPSRRSTSWHCCTPPGPRSAVDRDPRGRGRRRPLRRLPAGRRRARGRCGAGPAGLAGLREEGTAAPSCSGRWSGRRWYLVDAGVRASRDGSAAQGRAGRRRLAVPVGSLHPGAAAPQARRAPPPAARWRAAPTSSSRAPCPESPGTRCWNSRWPSRPAARAQPN